MNVAAVEAFVLPYVETNDAGSLRHACLVRVETVDGVVGWGEAVTIAKEAAAGTATLVQAWAAVMVGSPAEPEATARRLEDNSWWYGSAGFASFARSAIDMALWDIRGRAQQVPLLDLLGGAVRDRLPVLVSTHATLPDLDDQAARAVGWVEDLAACGIKIALGKRDEARLGRDLDRDATLLRLLRTGLGDQAQLCVDVAPRLRWDLETAVAHCRAFEESRVDWVEEPLGADDPEGYRALRAATTVRLAYGEREWSPVDVRRLVATGPVDVVGIDPGRVQGISGFRECERIVHAAGRESNAHAFSGPLVYAASVALSLASPSCHQLEVPPTRNELYDVVGQPPRPVGGAVVGLPGSGLGVDVDEDAVRNAAIHG